MGKGEENVGKMRVKWGRRGDFGVSVLLYQLQGNWAF